MYIWKISELKKQLINSDLEAAESFKYLIANTVLLTVGTIPYGEENQFDTLTGFIAVFTVVLGIWIAYKVNGGKDGNHFVHRYLAIGLVTFVRFFILIVLPSIIAKLAFEGIFLGDIPATTTLSDVFFVSALETIYVVMLARNISQVAKNSKLGGCQVEDAQQGGGTQSAR